MSAAGAEPPRRSFAASRRIGERLERLVPGGAHTYAKGPDQYPDGMAPVIVRGSGAHVWDVDGNEFVEYGSGLRSVALGHAHPRVVDAVARAAAAGTNFSRPSLLELEAAEAFLSVVDADMVKFAKNGSDVTTAAVRLARAVTGRDLVGVCADQPFFSTDDWFIGTTDMDCGIPKAVSDLTLAFPYGDLPAVSALLDRHEGRVACLVLEAETTQAPPVGWFDGLRNLCDDHGVLLVLDEMITGFRWDLGGAQRLYGIRPDLCTFGKALGNGFAVAALAGRRELMERGGLRTDEDRVFLLSTTHGAESTGLAAAVAVVETYRAEPVVDILHARGRLLAEGLRRAADDAGVGAHVLLAGRECNLVHVTLDAEGKRSQALRTLLMQEMLDRGVLAPSFVVSAATTATDVEQTVEAFSAACRVYARALESGPAGLLRGRAVRPALRRHA